MDFLESFLTKIGENLNDEDKEKRLERIGWVLIISTLTYITIHVIVAIAR